MTLLPALLLLGVSTTGTPPPPAVDHRNEPDAALDLSGKTTQEMLAGIEDGEWFAFYMVAAELLRRGEIDRAVEWFYVGQLRGRINATCIPQDPTGGPALLASLNSVLGTPINEHAGADPDEWAAAITRALAWDAAHADPTNPGPTCAEKRRSQRAGLADLAREIVATKAEIRATREKNGLPNR